MRSNRFAVLSNARKYDTESVAKNDRNDLISVSLIQTGKYGILTLCRLKTGDLMI